MHRRGRSRSPTLSLRSSPRYTQPRRSWPFFVAAISTGILLHIAFFGSGAHEYVQKKVPALKGWLPSQSCPTPIADLEEVDPSPPPAPVRRPVHPTDTPVLEDNQRTLSLEEIGVIVSRTNGFMGRDYSLGLGWNNMRYIIEAALLQAELLNRTLVLPSFVYARSCEWELESCAAFATMVNRGDAINWPIWKNLPIEKQMGWRIPMTMMLDMPHLRQKHNVLLLEEYLRYHMKDPRKEWSNGEWHRTDYLTPTMSIKVVANQDYDPPGVVRVDNKARLMKEHVASPDGEGVGQGSEPSGPVSDRLIALLKDKDKQVLGWEETLEQISDFIKDTNDVDEIETVLWKNGWAVLHTFSGVLGQDFQKTVVAPIRQVAPISSLRGWVDDYSEHTEDVLVIEGEVHLNRKPGGMRFTSIPARDQFADAVLNGLRPTKRVRDLAQKVHERMIKKVGGRMWMAGHMRRGDFTDLHWAMEKTLEDHLARIKSRLANGRKVLEEIHASGVIETYDVPHVVADQEQLRLEPPSKDDPFFLATDERSPADLKYVKDHGAILIGDLITIEDRREFGWGIMLTDILALVEQSVLARSHYFYGHSLSSVVGGAINLRAARGADPQTALAD